MTCLLSHALLHALLRQDPWVSSFSLSKPRAQCRVTRSVLRTLVAPQAPSLSDPCLCPASAFSLRSFHGSPGLRPHLGPKLGLGLQTWSPGPALAGAALRPGPQLAGPGASFLRTRRAWPPAGPGAHTQVFRVRDLDGPGLWSQLKARDLSSVSSSFPGRPRPGKFHTRAGGPAAWQLR